MKTLIVYDSFFGNTEQVAKAIGDSFGPQECVGVLRVGDVKPEMLKEVDLLIVGSPTRAFRPTAATNAFLKSLAPGDLHGMNVASFDTRINPEETSSGFLRFMVKIFGYAAKPIAGALQKKGGRLVQPPEGFYVKDTQGPLKDGELERAASWAAACRK